MGLIEVWAHFIWKYFYVNIAFGKEHSKLAVNIGSHVPVDLYLNQGSIFNCPPKKDKMV